jgi:hypothetical protein
LLGFGPRSILKRFFFEAGLFLEFPENNNFMVFDKYKKKFSSIKNIDLKRAGHQAQN